MQGKMKIELYISATTVNTILFDLIHTDNCFVEELVPYMYYMA